MPKREVEINITGDTSDAQASISDLERGAKKSFDQMAAAAEKESKEISDAFKRTGIRMEKDIKKSTADAKAAYQKIKNSGTASANDIRRAHTSMTNKIKKNNKELSSGNTGLLSSFKKLKGGIISLGVKAAAAGAIIVGAFGVKATKEAIKFEDALLDLQKVLSDTDGEASKFAKTAKELALQYGVSSAEVLQSAADFKQAGFDINKAFQRITGTNRKQTIGRSLSFDQYPKNFTQNVKQHLLTKGSWYGEIENIRTDGSKYLTDLNIDIIQDENSQISHFVGVFSDITKRKETEAELLKLANSDTLTGLPNRSYFHANLAQLVKVKTPLALLVFDLDNLTCKNLMFKSKPSI